MRFFTPVRIMILAAVSVTLVFYSFDRSPEEPKDYLAESEDKSDTQNKTTGGNSYDVDKMVNDPEFNEESVKADATAFHNFIFPSLADGSDPVEAKPLNPVYLSSYLPSGIDKIVVPFAHSGQIISLSYMRSDRSGGFIPGQLVNVSNQQWDRYPPVSRADAEQLLRNRNPTTAYEHIAGFYHMGDNNPRYKFRKMNSEEIYVLVNAVSGSVDQAPPPGALEAEIEKNTEASMPPIRRTDTGLITIDHSRSDGMSDEELAALKEEIDETNTAIQKGLLKIGPDFEVIYDRRDEQ